MAEPAQKSSMKEMLTSITIAFILAFVFRAFVIEAFVIPTGSMAPTLMGAHVRLQGPLTGYEFPVGPAEYADPMTRSRPLRSQSGEVTDPMLGPNAPIGQSVLTFYDRPLRAGDRILVLKYLLGLFDPARFDVVVFKSPVDPQTNFIKRLVGLPGEQVSLIDGDVFVRDAALPDDPEASNAWSMPGWRIARKGERAQRAVWQDVFNSFYTPREVIVDGRPIFRSPWVGMGAGWDTTDASYRYDRSAETTLAWDWESWPIRDHYAYNETTPEAGRQDDKFPVSDLRLRMGVEPDDELSRIAAIVTARGHEFKGEISRGEAVLSMRPLDGDWTEMAREPVREITPGRVTNVEFWHVDQHLELWVEGRRVASAPYDWTPAQRILYATGQTIDELLGRGRTNVFADPTIFRQATARWEFEGSPVTLHRVALQRDLHYQANIYRSPRQGPRHARDGEPAAGTHPEQIVELTDRQYFVCGDNSPASSDGRLWDMPDAWVSLYDETIGVVAQELMIGRAFFVYFPSPLNGRFGLPIPDAGRLRLIW